MDRYNFRKQFQANMSSNLIYFILNVLIGIWLIPYFIRNLGIEKYGFIPLAISLTSYVSLVTISLNSAVSRYLIIDFQKNDAIGANRTFNTSFWPLVILSIILIPLSGVFSFFAPKIFKIPEYFSSDAQWFFFLILISFIVSIFSAAFSVSTFCHNRLDLRNVIDTGNLFFRTLFVVIFFLWSARLVSVGLAYLIGAFISLILAYSFFKKLTPELKIKKNDFNFMKFEELMNTSGWLVVNQIGSLLFLQIDLFVVNILLGAKQTGQYGAILQWSVLLRSLAGVIAGVLAPMVFISHAKNEKDRIVFMSQKAVKFLGLGMAMVVGLLCGFARPLLRVWLGRDFVQFAPLLWLLTFHLVVNLSVLPLFAINTALNRVRALGIVTLAMGLANLLCAIVFVKYFGWGMYGVAAAGAIVLTLKNAIFTPTYAAHILKINYGTFLKPIAFGVLWALVNTGIGLILTRIISIDNWLKLSFAGCIAFLLSIIGTIILLGKDKRLVLSLLRTR